MSDSEILTATEASRAFSDVLHRVCYGGESFVIKKGQRLMARIVPVGEEEMARPAAKKESGQKHSAKKADMAPAAGTARPEVSSVPAAMSIPQGLTQEDVRFYEDLIAAIPKSSTA